jgi:endonuclease YncB( thermonuclease family)
MIWRQKMPQRDLIIGRVINVVDGDTFQMKVAMVGRNNRSKYGSTEYVRIDELKPVDSVSLTGERSKPILSKILKDRKITCVVNSRREDGMIEGVVFLSKRSQDLHLNVIRKD